MNNTDNDGPVFPTNQSNYGLNYCGEGMTLRQYAAIKLRVPNSGTWWLDDMIRESLRDELAARVMQTIFAGDAARMVANRDERYDETNWAAVVAANSFEMADAMLKERNR